MEEKKKKRKLRERLKDRYRLVILNESTLEDVWYAVLSRFNFMVWLGLTGIVLITLGIILVSFTPLREYIPGYPDGNIRTVYLENTLKVDSLQELMRVHQQYYDNISTILKGGTTLSYTEETDSVQKPDISAVSDSEIDSSFMEEMELEDRYSLSEKKNHDGAIQVMYEYDLSKLFFFSPVKGTLTNNFNPSTGHFGIDLVSNANEPVLSVTEGTVVMEGWTFEAGYVIQVQHPNNLISIYKHNSILLKKTGERIKAGEAIAIIGNTGEYTTGPHLHFELWHNGKALNPVNYIDF